MSRQRAVVPTRFPEFGVTHDGRVVHLASGVATRGYIGRGPYRRCNAGYPGRLVHRLIAETLVRNPAPGVLDVVHHKDGNTENNASSNLMWVTLQLNTMIRSKSKGCYYNKRRRKWYARCKVQGRTHGLGWYETYEEGHRAYLAFRDAAFADILGAIVRRAEQEREGAV